MKKLEKKSVLVIDDSPEMLLLQRTMLEMEGFNVITAQSGSEAFDLLAEMEEPSLILLDVQMKDMSGPTFLSMLEEKSPQIVAAVPVVFLTGVAEVPKANVRGVIRKPFDMNNFLTAVHHFIDSGQKSALAQSS